MLSRQESSTPAPFLNRDVLQNIAEFCNVPTLIAFRGLSLDIYNAISTHCAVLNGGTATEFTASRLVRGFEEAARVAGVAADFRVRAQTAAMRLILIGVAREVTVLDVRGTDCTHLFNALRSAETDARGLPINLALQHLAALKELHADGGSRLSSRLIAALRPDNEIEVVNFREALLRWPSSAFNILSVFRNVRRLDLSNNGNAISDTHLRHLSYCTKLRELTLENSRLHGHGLQHLRDLKHFKTLTFSSSDMTLEEISVGLPTLDKLTRLSMPNLPPSITLELLDAVVPLASHLKHLRLELPNMKLTGELKGLGNDRERAVVLTRHFWNRASRLTELRSLSVRLPSFQGLSDVNSPLQGNSGGQDNGPRFLGEMKHLRRCELPECYLRDSRLTSQLDGFTIQEDMLMRENGLVAAVKGSKKAHASSRDESD